MDPSSWLLLLLLFLVVSLSHAHNAFETFQSNVVRVSQLRIAPYPCVLLLVSCLVIVVTLLIERVFNLLVVILFEVVVIAQENLDISRLGRRAHPDIVLFNEQLLLVYHVLKVNNSPGLELQIQQQLDILGLQIVVLDHQGEEVFVVLHRDSVSLNTVADLANL